jgi:1-acyl-sn-glycerol-3-phosphate acyltransferase
VLKKLLSAYYDVAVRVFFRRIEVEGREHVPLDGPLFIAPNHLNAFVDPIVIQSVLPRELTITAKNTLAGKRLYGFLMRVGGVVAFHRQQDRGKGADIKENAEAVAECRRRLDRGDALCIFPEGISHSDPALRPFKMGVARIALEHALSDDGGSLHILPVGQICEAKERFRSRVWIRFGEPIDVRAWAAAHPTARRRDLTAEMESRVRALTLNFASERDAILTDWAAQIVLGDSEWSERVRTMARLGPRLAAHGDVARKVRTHRAALRRLGLTPADLDAERGQSAGDLLLTLLGFPIALWGALNNLLPSLALRRVTIRFSTARDLWASTAVFTSAIVFPVLYLLQTALVWALVSFSAAAVYALLLAPTGYFALRYGERVARAWRRVRVAARMRGDAALRERLKRDTSAVAEELINLCDGMKAPQMAS